jgi:hypothetical protein
VRPAEAAEEDVRQRLALPFGAVGIDVQDDRPRRAQLVVVVHDRQRHFEAGHVDVADLPVLDEPCERAVADAVGRAAPGRPSVMRHGQIGSQLQDSKYFPLAE